MSVATDPHLEIDDIQAGALFERPSPYVGAYLMLHITDRADGRELVRRLHRIVTSARASGSQVETSLTVAFTYHGLAALGVPQTSLDSFAPEFREGMASRAALLGDRVKVLPSAGSSRWGAATYTSPSRFCRRTGRGWKPSRSRRAGLIRNCPG